MKRNLLIDDLSAGDELDVLQYEFLKALALLDDESESVYIEDDDNIHIIRKKYPSKFLEKCWLSHPEISDWGRGLFGVFSSSDAFGVLEHTVTLLDALAHPVEGLSLSKYDELGLV